ncbi:MAG: rubrerythrin [Candidatus Zixiibacteriota bacterium]
MPSIKGTKTEHNLLASFAGESQARSRYTYFAEKAREEGYQQIAAIFMETAENELEHAKRFFSYLEGGMKEIQAAYPAGVIGTTKENLKAAAEGENEEHTKLYPTFAEIAADEGFPEISRLWKNIAKVEVEHERRYLKLLGNIEKEMVFEKEEKVRWKCRNCGYVHEGTKAPKICPTCLYEKEYFELKESNY